MTLPLINALSTANAAKRKQIIRTIKKYNDRPKKVQEVVDFVNQSGGLEYARLKMEMHLENARELLSKFPSSVERSALEELINYTGKRKK